VVARRLCGRYNFYSPPCGVPQRVVMTFPRAEGVAHEDRGSVAPSLAKRDQSMDGRTIQPGTQLGQGVAQYLVQSELAPACSHCRSHLMQ
jgi:hypothetical protein